MSFGAKARVRHVGRVVAFKLDGAATLPPDAPFGPPPNPPEQVASTPEVSEGAQHYAAYCARCHGFGTDSANVVPDLRRSLILTDKSTWQQVVIGGAFEARGMVGWAKYLNPAQAETIRAYVGEQARALKKQETEKPAK